MKLILILFLASCSFTSNKSVKCYSGGVLFYEIKSKYAYAGFNSIVVHESDGVVSNITGDCIITEINN